VTIALVRVRYPLRAGEIVLRSSIDWERDVTPVRRTGTTFDYELELGEERFCYFKPILRDREDAQWAQGPNSLAVAGSGDPTEIFPHFSPDATCHVCRLEERVAQASGAVHRLRVLTPAGYDENTLCRYPVLYMQDGQNLFFPEEAYMGRTWRVEETLHDLASMSAIRRMIVVGVWPGDRHEDYTAPGYEGFGRFLVDDVKPWIDSRYRTRPGPEHTATLGSSLGGVVSLHLGLAHPDVFGAVACLSSTFGYRDDLAERVAAGPKPNLRIYLDSGWPGDNYEVTLHMRDRLVAAGWEPGLDLVHVAHPRASHDEGAWAARLHQPLAFLLGEHGPVPRPAPRPAVRSGRLTRTFGPVRS